MKRQTKPNLSQQQRNQPLRKSLERDVLDKRSDRDMGGSFGPKTRNLIYYVSPEEHELLKRYIKTKKLSARTYALKVLKHGEEAAQQAPEKETLKSRLALNDRFLNRYHVLVDKRLNGVLSERDARELRKIEKELDLIEDNETSGMERAVEQRHQILMQQLRELTAELHKFSSGDSAKPGIQ